MRSVQCAEDSTKWGGYLFVKCKNVKHVWRLLDLEDVRLDLVHFLTPMELDSTRRDTALVLLWERWSVRK